MLNSSSKGLGQGFFLDELGNLLNLLETEVALMSDILGLLSVSLVVSEFLDDEC